MNSRNSFSISSILRVAVIEAAEIPRPAGVHDIDVVALGGP